MATVLTLTFEDGHVDEITVRPIHLVMAERARSDLRTNPIESTYFAGWIAAGKPGPFDDWLATLVDASEDEKPVPPPNPDPSPDALLTSP